MSTVIKIENLYKEYRLGVIGHGTLYRDLQSWWAKLKGKEDPNTLIGRSNYIRNKEEQILALDDINLEIKNGEALGIIGANGAGKSTLLKILSQVTAPTKGCIKIRGRIASLLEVGTGFHPELTGRENIYLNGVINGMNNTEVSRKLDEIVDFAGVEQFLDTPVKRYSSGMHVRLGFAVSAHLDQEILVVDEVLAVGDATFQKKAIRKMKDVSKSGGRTVLFVSHNMESIKSLCTRSVLLEEGRIINDGLTFDVIESYLHLADEDVHKYSGKRTWEFDSAPGNDSAKLIGIYIKNEKGEICSEFDVTEPVQIEVFYKVLTEGEHLTIGLQFHNSKGVWLFFVPDDYVRRPWGRQNFKEVGLYKATFLIPGNLFNTGVIFLDVGAFYPPMQSTPTNTPFDEHHVICFNISDSYHAESARGSFPYSWGDSAIRPKIKCETHPTKSSLE